MSKRNGNEIDISLSQTEKKKLETILEESQRHTALNDDQLAEAINQDQLNRLTRRMADLTEMILRIDSQMESLKSVARLSHQKSERLSQRLDAVIRALDQRK